MFRRKPAPDLIRGGYRFADKNKCRSRISRAMFRFRRNGTWQALRGLALATAGRLAGVGTAGKAGRPPALGVRLWRRPACADYSRALFLAWIFAGAPPGAGTYLSTASLFFPKSTPETYSQALRVLSESCSKTGTHRRLRSFELA